MQDFFTLFFCTDSDVVLRVVLSVILGFFIGLEREMTNKAAGLRTNILVCLGSCLFTILSIFGFSNALSIYPMGDPARVAAQILTGIGFIGGGCVLRHGTSIYGLTTAATLWATASVGMACGCGKYSIAVLCAVLSVATLTLIRIFEKNCIPKNQKNNISLRIVLTCAKSDYIAFSEDIMKKFENISEYSSKVYAENSDNVKITFKTLTCCKNAIENTFEKMKDDTRVIELSVKEISE
jgi:putative Mg2+ transporter-C (MgtC) family protein